MRRRARRDRKKIAARGVQAMAVKAGQTLSSEEQQALVADLEACAHREPVARRPTISTSRSRMLELSSAGRAPASFRSGVGPNQLARSAGSVRVE